LSSVLDYNGNIIHDDAIWQYLGNVGKKSLSKETISINKNMQDSITEIDKKAMQERFEADKASAERRAEAQQRAIERSYDSQIRALENQLDILNDADEESVANARKKAALQEEIARKQAEKEIKLIQQKEKAQRRMMEMTISFMRATGQLTKEQEKEMRDGFRATQQENADDIADIREELGYTLQGIQRDTSKAVNDILEEQAQKRKEMRAEELQQEKDYKDWQAEQAYEAAQHAIAMYEKEAEGQKAMLSERLRLIEKHYDDLRSALDAQREYEDEIAAFAMQKFEQALERLFQLV